MSEHPLPAAGPHTRPANCGADQSRLFPFLDDEFGLRLHRLVTDLQLDIFRAHAFLHFERRATTIVALVRALASEQRDEFVLARLEIADEDAMDAALQQGLRLA